MHKTHYIPVKKGKRILFEDGAKIKILSNEFTKFFVIWRVEQIKLKVLHEKYIVDYRTKEWDKLAFEKRKQISFNRMLDNKHFKLLKKKKKLQEILYLIRNERKAINTL